MSVTAERVLEESAIDQSGNALKPKSGMLSLLGLNMEISKIDDFWNTRMLKNGIVPTIQPAEGPVLVLSGVDELGAPKGGGHRRGVALDTLDLMKDSDLQGSFATNKGARKVSAALILGEYVRDLHTLDTFCADKQLVPYPPLSTIDPELKCQDENGARRFTGRECFMNLEKILTGTDPEDAPIASWYWDPENSSSMPRSRGAAKWCPFLSDTTKLIEVRDYVKYADDSGRGVFRYGNLQQTVSTITLTFGESLGQSNFVLGTHWHRSSLIDRLFPITVGLPTSQSVSYPIYRDGVRLLNPPNTIPEIRNWDGHFDHLHIEVKEAP